MSFVIAYLKTNLSPCIERQIYLSNMLNDNNLKYLTRRADPGFPSGGGGGVRGGQKDYVPARTLRARNRTNFRQGSRARLRALEL